jgi:hypothetical protein
VLDWMSVSRCHRVYVQPPPRTLPGRGFLPNPKPPGAWAPQTTQQGKPWTAAATGVRYPSPQGRGTQRPAHGEDSAIPAEKECSQRQPVVGESTGERCRAASSSDAGAGTTHTTAYSVVGAGSAARASAVWMTITVALGRAVGSAVNEGWPAGATTRTSSGMSAIARLGLGAVGSKSSLQAYTVLAPSLTT